MSRPRILFLDAYDSFSNNIVSLLTTLLGVDVDILPIDADLSPAKFAAELVNYDAVVCGPGPGSPDLASDVGLMTTVWTSAYPQAPALGICLGFQSLARHLGAPVRRLRRGLHGMIHEVEHIGIAKSTTDHEVPDATAPTTNRGDIFTGVGKFRATLYHSLC